MTSAPRLPRVGINWWFVPLLLSACQPATTKRLRNPPPSGQLERLSVIARESATPIIAVAGFSDCRILTIDQLGGAFLQEQAGVARLIGTVPGRRLVRFESPSDDAVVIWAASPPLLGTVRLAPFQVDSVPLRQPPIGEPAVGPAVKVGSSFAVARFGDPLRPLRVPNRVQQGRLFDLLDAGGAKAGALGPEIEMSGDLFPWQRLRGAVTVVDDEVVWLTYADGTVRRYGLRRRHAQDLVELPHYFKSVPPRQTILALPWIQYNGDFSYVTETVQVRTASFGPNGRIYAIRPYGYRWVSAGRKSDRSAGSWVASQEALEVYAQNGDLLGAYSVPTATKGVRVDNAGRLMLLVRGKVEIFQDPHAPRSHCHGPSHSTPITKG